MDKKSRKICKAVLDFADDAKKNGLKKAQKRAYRKNGLKVLL